MLLSAMMLAYIGCLHVAEYCYNPSVSPPLLPGAFSFHEASIPFMLVKVASSKNSIKGFQVTIDCSGTRICAFCSMKLYLIARGAAATQPVFLFQDGSPLTHASFSSFMKRLFRLAGISASNITPTFFKSGCGNRCDRYAIARVRDITARTLEV